jgi:hypothetical protein
MAYQELLLQNDYAADLKFQAQQMKSHLEMCVLRGMTDGAQKRHQLIGVVDPIQIVERHQPTPYIPNTHDDRWTVQSKWVLNDFFDKFDEMRTTVTDVTGRYVQNAIHGLNRKKDAIILTALGGSAVTGQTGTGTQALPSGQKVLVGDHTFDPDGGTANVGLTPYKLQNALAILEGQMGSLEEIRAQGGRVHAAFSAKQKQALMSHVQTVSELYNNGKPMTTNQLAEFLGIELHVYANSLVSVANGTVDGSANQLAFVWLEDAIQLDFPAESIETRITERSDLNYSWQCWASMQLGAVRVDDNKVVQIACDPTPVIVG